jgi:hypothetical protein
MSGFCIKCGESISPPAERCESCLAGPVRQQTQPESKKPRFRLLMPGIAALLLAAALGAVMFPPSTPGSPGSPGASPCSSSSRPAIFQVFAI